MANIFVELSHLLESEKKLFSIIEGDFKIDSEYDEPNSKIFYKILDDGEYRKGRLSLYISFQILDDYNDRFIKELMMPFVDNFINKHFSNYKIVYKEQKEENNIYKFKYEFCKNNNLLIVGNGFDIAHNLKTKYGDFLNYYKGIQSKDLKLLKNVIKKMIDNNIIDNIIKNTALRKTILKRPNLITENGYQMYYRRSKEIKRELEILLKDNGNRNIDLELYKNVIANIINKKEKKNKRNITKSLKEEIIAFILKKSEDNILFKHLYKENDLNDNWIDIEAEIGNIVKNKEKELYNNNIIYIGKSLIDVKNEIKNLEKNLDEVIYLLEVYLLKEIYSNHVKENNLILDIAYNITHLLSFNYTDTFRETYIKNKNDILYLDDHIDFIHGQLGKHNLVFGTNETLHDESKNKNLDCIYFKKYFQRIYKKTGCKYKKWLNEGIDNVYIYGHSLDVTDKDVINEVIQKSKHVIIYYHSEEAYRQQITNLVRVLEHGQDDLVEMVYGVEPKIEFRPTF